MADNALTKVARIASKAAQGATYKDAKGNIQIIKPAGDSNYMDFTNFLTSTNGTGGSTGGNTDPNNPDPATAGANYYAGSLANGEITQRNFEWGGTDDPTKSNTITFKDAQGSKFNGNYDGIQLLGHIQKKVITKGVAGATTNLPLNYDIKNAAKSGYYTTSASYPVYINDSSLTVGSKVSATIIGIGENLGGKNVKAPSISLTLNADMTLTLTHDKGYNNDGAEKPTGSTYDLVIDTIATFSTQAAVAQLPSSINLFTGSTDSDAAVAGAGDYYENVMDGIELTFGDIKVFYNARDSFTFTMKDIGLSEPVRIPKEKLIEGSTVTVFNTDDFKPFGSDYISNQSGEGPFLVLYKFLSNELTVNKGNIKINITGEEGWAATPTMEPGHGKAVSFNLIKVTPYKK